MTYVTGGPIAALDYNTFSTLSGGMNEIYADLHSGATTLPNAGYGYGQTPALTAVSAGNTILATQWDALFQTMRKCGTHQGTTVVPPLPVSDPAAGDVIAAYNTPTTLSALVATLTTNRFNLAVGQTAFTSTAFVQPPAVIPWTNTLTFNYRVNFSSWNNARYFFNSGGFVTLSGNYSLPTTPEEIEWQSMFTNMSPLVFNKNSTTPNTGSGGTAIGFYNLTTSPQVVYFKNYGSGVYTASYIQVTAWLVNAAGTDGQVNFSIELVNLDSSPPPTPKTHATTYTVNEYHSSGVIAYPGPAVAITAVGANNGFIST